MLVFIDKIVYMRSKIEDAVHRQFTVMHRDIKLNRIDDMIIVIEP